MRLVTIAAVFLLVFIVALAVFAPWISPHDPLAQELINPFASPSSQHWLGTDELGRDVMSRILWGARPALTGMIIAIITVALIGVPWGLVAGYAGGAVDAVLMRAVDIMLVFPGLVLALVLTSVFGPSLFSAMTAIGVVFSPILARVVRAAVLVVRDREYVQITRLYGASAFYRMTRHILPNAFGAVLVQLTLLSGIALMVQTGLGFLGVGIQPPIPSWGQSLAESFRYIVVNPSATVAPGIAVVVTVLALYRVGDALRDGFGNV
jgi:peptide/nickel transport system permease protein